jgi:hypothetical protein
MVVLVVVPAGRACWNRRGFHGELEGDSYWTATITNHPCVVHYQIGTLLFEKVTEHVR